MKTLIIGGGAAGMAAAIAAAQRGDDVTVLERNAKTLKKLGVTGNGRGNLLNSGNPVYYGDTDFARQIFLTMPYPRLAAFWEDLGVPLRQEEEGRVYPAAMLASVAADALRLKAKQLRVICDCHTRALRLFSKGNEFWAEAEEIPPSLPTEKKKQGIKNEPLSKTYRADRVIVTAGGAAAPAQGSDGSGYPFLTAFGHRLIPVHPALSALLTETTPISGLKGQRARVKLSLFHGTEKNPIHTTVGEALFAEDGISGIAAMQLARFVTAGSRLILDLRPMLNKEDASPDALVAWLQKLCEMRGELPLSELCTGILPPPLSRAFLKAAGITGLDRSIQNLSRSALQTLAHTFANFPLAIWGVRGFESAQVTAGGIDPADFDPFTLESRLQKGLYAAGEILNVDGDCGGFNLMFALASGLLAGQ